MKLVNERNPVILVVDDDREDRHFFREALSEISPCITVIFQKDTDGLLEEMERTWPSLIFIEYRLPKENGIEFVQRLKAHSDLSDIPVVMWSNARLQPIVSAAYKAGVQLYLEKPWELKIWVQKIEKVLEHNRISRPFLSPSARLSL
ncbi:response regulator [Paraflavisolibacter sp. H34]|uniref:response regulator n=1 Tax=Huijunlia imazamoxiresistens TaxID=3127457 RepID=UPI0030181571